MTQIESDGTMWRRMLETAGRSDAALWQELITRALAVPLPYRPALAASSTISIWTTGMSWSPSMTSPGRCSTW